MKIHQIWLGDTIPDQINEYMKTWRNIPDTEYRLWRDQDVEIYQEDLVKASISTLHAACRADLLRDLILRDHAGLYIDSDCEKVGDIPKLNEFMYVLNTNREPAHPDNYVIYAPDDCQEILDMIDYGFNKVPWFTNTFFRFGIGPIIKLFGDKYSMDVTKWCTHHNDCSWFRHPVQEFRNIPESKGKRYG